MEDRYEDWAAPLREHARATYLRVLRARADRTSPQDVDTVVAAHRRILEVDPYDEPAHRAVVVALAGAGRHGEAHRARRRYEAMMREVGVQPDAV